jgi:hypothetical protein
MSATRRSGAGVAIVTPDILEATVPGYIRPNFCDHIRGSGFDT